MSITPESEVEGLLALLPSDLALTWLVEDLIQKFTSRGVLPENPTPTLRDWMNMDVEYQGRQRKLASIVIQIQAANQSCPQWVRKIKTGGFGS